MLTHDDRHLTEDQLDALFGLKAAGLTFTTSGSAYSESIARHLSDCEECRQRADSHADARNRLNALKSSSKAKPQDQCPDFKEWTDFAAGLGDQRKTEKMLDHAVDCDHCGPFLKVLMDDFADSSSPEEIATLSRLESAGAVWQRRLAARLSATMPVPHDKEAAFSASRPFISSWRWAFASLVCLILAGFAAWFFPYSSRAQVQRLIMEAYAEGRTVPLRIPGAGFGQLRVNRGSSSYSDESASLLEAKGILARNLPKNSNDPAWLQAQARADLLDWKYDAALATLSRALDSRSADRSLKIDTASALFERAEDTGHATDYGRAVELLSEVLRGQPDNLVALFNRAILFERLFLFNEAAQDWQHYLRIDPTGAWSDEARHRLDGVEEKLEERRKGSAELLLPSQLLSTHSPDSLIDARIEDYLDVALREWLPTTYLPAGPSAKVQTPAPSVAILHTVAVILARRHDDAFLLDLLDSSSRASYPRAVAELADAVRANGTGDQAAALAAAKRSELAFLALGNRAGVLRSQFEQLYAWQFYVKARDCSDKAFSLASEAKGLHYAWLQVQFLLEKAFCSNIEGNLSDARVFVRQARQVAVQSNFHGLALRALVGMAGMEWEAGSVPAAWTEVLGGLQEFWAGHGSPLRGFTLYSILDLVAENDRRPFLEVAAIRESLELSGQKLDCPSEAATRYRLGNAALMAGLEDVATEEFRKADELFSRSPNTKPTEHWRSMSAIGLARVELQHHHPQRALEALQASPLSQTANSDRLNSVDYFAALGEAQREQGNIPAAEKAFRTAIDSCESALNTLQDRRDRLTWSRECGMAYRPAVQLRILQADATGSLELWQAYRSLEAHAASAAKNGEISQLPNQNRSPHSADLGMVENPQRATTRTLIIYAVLPEGLAIWTTDDHGNNLRWIPSDTSQLIRLASRFSDQCADPSSNASFLRTDGRALYELLIAPVAEHLTPERALVVEPDDDLESISFSALSDSSGQYLGARFALLISPGRIPAAHSGAEMFFVSAEHLLAVAPAASDPEKGLLPLEDANDEVREIAAMFPAAVLLAGRDATVEAIRRALPDASLFHYAGHSRVDVGGAGLLLSSELHGTGAPRLALTAGDLSPALLKNCRLAVLSACSTSRGEEGRWIDRESLVLAFLNAGVKRVVASRWSVDSHTTRRLMSDFYRHLLETKSVETALHEAAAAIRSEPATAHPFYWASFETFGGE